MVIPLPPPERVVLTRVPEDAFEPGEPVFGAVDLDGRTIRWVVVRRGPEHYAAFVDRCPHWSVSLASGGAPHHDADAIFCSRHGARFRLDDGVCDAGPCEGRALVSLEVDRAPGAVTLYLLRDRLAPGRA